MAMKLLMFVMIFYIAFGTVTISQKSSRGITTEPVIFEVLVDAPCESYLAQALSSIQISFVAANPTCLPISPVNPVNDVNDYHAHVFCTNVDGGRRSLFRFHEIFSVDEDETPAPGAQFIVSWVVNKRFREHTSQYLYKRRPSCTIGNDVCSPTQIVNDCWDNSVDIDNGFVDASDRVYFVPPSVTVGTCSLGGSCCPYISLTNLGLCGGTAPNLCQGINCNDNNSCTVDSCNPATGTCSNIAKSCTDNKFCTDDTCDPLTGSCNHTPVSCDDSNLCTLDACVEGTNGFSCSHTAMNCDDGNKCTTDTCVNGVCQHAPVTCSSSNFCDVNGTCDSNTGSCVYQTQSCDDSSICTLGDYCNRTLNNGTGACAHTGFLDCGVGIDKCHFPVCDAVLGCQQKPLSCYDGNICTLDSCNPATGDCSSIFLCRVAVNCASGFCANQICSVGTPCPLDNGSQNKTDYCGLNNLCSTGLTCDAGKNCCANSSGVCQCPAASLC